MKSTIQDKTKLVNSVFSDVHKKYDLMNDIMSWNTQSRKENLSIDELPETKLIDVASGTGDVNFSNKTKTRG